MCRIVLAGDHLDELAAEPGQFFRWRFLTPDTWRTAHPFSLSAPPTADAPAADGQGAGRRQPAAAGHRRRHLGRRRRAVRRDDRRPAYPPRRPAARGWSRDHADAGPVRDHADRGRPGADADLPCPAPGARWSSAPSSTQLAERAVRGSTTCSATTRRCSPRRPCVRLVPGLAARDVYLCGPPGLAGAVRRALAEAGLPRRQLHEERFASEPSAEGRLGARCRHAHPARKESIVSRVQPALTGYWIRTMPAGSPASGAGRDRGVRRCRRRRPRRCGRQVDLGAERGVAVEHDHQLADERQRVLVGEADRRDRDALAGRRPAPPSPRGVWSKV